MAWMRIIGDAVQYIEAHITEELTTDDIANAVCISPFYFQRGFAMLCGTTVGEYIRCRRLALTGNALATTNARVIDIALRYGYDSPDSFTKAFTRFHGVTPTAVRQGALLKSFAPLKIKFSLEGGYLMDYKIKKRRRLPCWQMPVNSATRTQRRRCRSSGRRISPQARAPW